MKNKYPFLDGLRTIAILMVFYEHIHYFVLLDHFKPLEEKWTSDLYFYFFNTWHWDLSGQLIWFDELIHRPSTGQGTLGVDLFFVISGFLITRILAGNCEGGLQIGRFYVHRFLKIYPSYFALIIGTFLYLFLIGHSQINYLGKELPWYLLFFQNVQGQIIQSLGHTWSLVVEEQFYFFYPLIAFIVFKSCSSASLRRNALMLVAILVIMIAPFLRYYYHFENNTAMATLYHFDALALGCLLALNEGLLISIRHLKFLGLAFWLIGASLYVYLMFIFKWADGWRAWYAYDLSGLAALSIFLAGYLGVSTFSSLGVIQWIGRRSYGIYLWHLLILTVFLPFRDRMSPGLLIVLFIPAAILMGIVSSFTVEKYFLNLRQKLIP